MSWDRGAREITLSKLVASHLGLFVLDSVGAEVLADSLEGQCEALSVNLELCSIVLWNRLQILQSDMGHCSWCDRRQFLQSLALFTISHLRDKVAFTNTGHLKSPCFSFLHKKQPSSVVETKARVPGSILRALDA